MQAYLLAALRQPEECIHDLPLLAPADRSAILAGFNATRAQFPSGYCVHELFENQADENPDALCLALRKLQLSYGDVEALANRLATHLVDLGAGPGVPIGLMMGRSAEMYIAMLAILKVSQPYMLVCASVNEAMAGNVPQDMMFCSTWRYKKPPTGSGNSPTSFQVAHVHTMRFGSTAKVLLKCKLKYCRISECVQAVCEPKIGRT